MYILMGHISLVDHSVIRGPRELLGIRRIQIRVKDTVIPFRIQVVEHEICIEGERKINYGNINTIVKLQIFITLIQF